MEGTNESPDASLGLSSSQQTSLTTFSEITQINDSYLCIQILQENQWDLESALNSFVQGQQAAVDEDSSYNMPSSNDSNYQQTISHRRVSASTSSNDGNRRSNMMPSSSTSSRQPQELNNFSTPAQGGGLLDMMLLPLRWLFQASPIVHNPTIDAQTFIREFSEKYGESRSPSFHQGSYQSAVALAFSQSKFLVVYLHSPMHDKTDDYCREVLCSQNFINLVNNDVIIWGGKIWDAEGYGLSTQLGASSFPFLALMVCQSNRVVQFAERIQVYTEENEVLRRLRSSMEGFSENLRRNRQEQARRDESARLREQQNREYQESMEADRREADRRRQEQEEKERLEEERKQQEELAAAIELSKRLSRDDKIRRLRDSFNALPEPSASASDVATIRFQLPRGKKVTRCFQKTDKIERIMEYLALMFFDEGDLTKSFGISIPYPKTEISDYEKTVEEMGLFPRGMLYVQDLDI